VFRPDQQAKRPTALADARQTNSSRVPKGERKEEKVWNACGQKLMKRLKINLWPSGLKKH